MKKNFVSDFDEIQNMQSLWPKDLTHKIWAESETKNFSDSKIFFVSDFTQILCVRPFDPKDFKFWVFFKKNFFQNFSIFS